MSKGTGGQLVCDLCNADIWGPSHHYTATRGSKPWEIDICWRCNQNRQQELAELGVFPGKAKGS